MVHLQGSNQEKARQSSLVFPWALESPHHRLRQAEYHEIESNVDALITDDVFQGIDAIAG